MQQARDLHRRFLRKHESVLQTRFVARNHLIIAENEVIKQKITNEDLRYHFKESMKAQHTLQKSTEQEVQESLEKMSLRSLQLKDKKVAHQLMLHQVEHDLVDFVTTRKQLQASESMLASFKTSFATIMG